MTNTQWHAGPELLRRYAEGTLDQVGQAAVEAHVSGCAECRGHASALVSPSELEPAWDRVLATVTAPPPSRLSRALVRLGVRETDVVVLRASANLVLALAFATTAAVGFALVAAQLRSSQQELFYLAIAPLMPAILVAGAYDSTDPLRELAEATPHSRLRVALLRTIVAVLGALPLVLAMGLVPQFEPALAAWLLPALALTSVLLVLLTWWPATTSVLVVATGWLVTVGLLRAGSSLDVVTAAGGQVLSAALLLAATAVLLVRFELLRLVGARR
jgi:hypothetical protein